MYKTSMFVVAIKPLCAKMAAAAKTEKERGRGGGTENEEK
jgi:hypothetical protein